MVQGYLNHDWWRGNFWLDSCCIRTDLCIMKRSNSYGHTSYFPLSMENIGLLTPQMIMVIQQSHLILHIPVMLEAYVRSSFLTDPLFGSFITWGGSRSILLMGTELTPPFHFTPHDCFIWQVDQAVGLSLILTAVPYWYYCEVCLLVTRSSTHTFIFILGKSSLCALTWKCCYAIGSAVLFFSWNR